MNDPADNGERTEPSEYRSPFPAWVCPRTKVDAALLALTGYSARHGRDGKRDGRRAAMVEALEGRASYHAIRHWRRGNAPPPQWARELIRAKLMAHGAIALEI